MIEPGPESLFLLGWRGTLRRGDRAQPGAAAFLTLLRETSSPFLVLTNDSSNGPRGHAMWARGAGLPLDEEDFLTSSMLAITHLTVHHAGRPVYVVGTPELREELAAAGIPLAGEEGNGFDRPPVVLVGRDPRLDSDHVHAALNLIRAGAPLVATHGDAVHPTETGVEADCGALLALLVAATGARAVVLGKPDPRLVDHALSLRAGARRDRTVVVGCGRADLDLAQRAGVAAAVVCRDARERAGRFPGARIVVSDLDELTRNVGDSRRADAVMVEWQQVRSGDERYY